MEAWLELESQTLLAQKWLAYDWVLVPKLGGDMNGAGVSGL